MQQWRCKTRNVTFSTCALVSSVIESALHSRTIPLAFEPQSKTVFSQFHTHRVAQISPLRTHTPHLQRSGVLLISPARDLQLVRIAQQQKTHACSGQWQEEKGSTCIQVTKFPFVCLWRHGNLCNFFSVKLARCCRKSYRSTYRRVHQPRSRSKFS